MTSLYNRATPSQAYILRVIEGAIKNACDAHRDLKISPRHRRSIAKRAAGTLTAQWPDVLAARPSDRSGQSGLTLVTSSPLVAKANSHPQVRKDGGRASHLPRRAPILQLRSLISRDMTRVRQEEHSERFAAFVDVLRMIHAITEAADPR